ncbi:OLC1v1020800C1 [Oldenlandia corymbosa var. corymbosa]|uniref:OLC1v1020800C1 n=1 Tax=Oldenlandia corymbosa var. corymbosa TaxID=529605 RepID=A0AAV1BWD2_OLDCO|nr:OLC1v1020800C1 [Oldenlandia corymbosa var. corymbosa]
MEMKKIQLRAPLAIAMLMCLIISSSAALLGGFSTADPKDPQVVDSAKFAVTEHNKQNHTDLVFNKVVKAERQVVAGTNYRLGIEATDNGAAHRYIAEVYVALNQTKFLTSFKQLGN